MSTNEDDIPMTPVERRGLIWVKRDDLWDECGVAKGGKARTAGAICRYLLGINVPGAVCCLDRSSSVPAMLARVFRYYGKTIDLFTTSAKPPMPRPFTEAMEAGATVHTIYPGYMSVRQKRAREFAHLRGLANIGVGLKLYNIGIDDTADQVLNIPKEVKRIIIPVGSGMMLKGVARGVERYFGQPIPILGVHVGRVPSFSDEYPPFVSLIDSGAKFGKELNVELDGLMLDPVYEAHCAKYLEPGDLLWVVAHRETA